MDICDDHGISPQAAWIGDTNKLFSGDSTNAQFLQQNAQNTNGQGGLSESGATGVYIFGSQRLWYKHLGYNTNAVSLFYQYGVNNSGAMSMKQSIGGGLTYFGPIRHRDDDSLGAGVSYAWLNQQCTDRPTELMYQAYYRAKILTYIYLEPVISYIPTQGQSASLSPVWADTLRAIALF